MNSRNRSVNVRTVRPSDAQEWLRLRMALWPDADPDELSGDITLFLAEYPNSSQPTLEAAFVCPKLEGGLCGFIEVSIHDSAPECETDRIGYLEGWYVDPEWRGQGVGRALAERVEEWAREAGCLEMASDTTAEYPLSPKAHEGIGYQEAARFFRKDLR